MSLFKFLFDMQKDNTEVNQTEIDNCLLALSMYIHFYYDKIVSEPKMMDFLVSSERVLNKFHLAYSDYTRRQIESIFIAFNLLMLITISGIYTSFDTDNKKNNLNDLD